MEAEDEVPPQPQQQQQQEDGPPGPTAPAAAQPADPLLGALSFSPPTESNIEQLKALNRAIFPINYHDRIYADILACGEVTQLAYLADALVGALACRLERTPQGITMYILTLGVLAPYRGRGVGSALLARSLALTAEALPEVVEAYLHTSNAEAIRFYQRFGFEVGETIEGYYRRLDPPDAVVLRRRLQPDAVAAPPDP
eukprot:scaffold6.g2906.t1